MLVFFMAENKDRAPLPTDGNDRVIAGGVSSSDGFTPLPFEIDPLTGRLLVSSDGTGGGASGGLTDEELRATPVETQDDAAAALLTAIETNTEVLGALAVVVKALQQGMVNPPHMDKSLNRVRETAIIESGTITTVSTVTAVTTLTTLTGLTNIDSYQGKLLMVGQNISAWASVVRRNIT